MEKLSFAVVDPTDLSWTVISLNWRFSGVDEITPANVVSIVPMTFTDFSCSISVVEAKEDFESALILTDKWNANGTLRRFEGITCVSPLQNSSQLHHALRCVQDIYRTHPLLSRFIGFLPPSSFHVTTMDLLSCSETDFDTNASFKEAEFARIVDVMGSLQNLLPDTLCFHAYVIHFGQALKLKLCPDPVTRVALDAWRTEAVSACDHPQIKKDKKYGFHVSIGYRLFDLPEDVQRVFDTLSVGCNALLQSVGSVTVKRSNVCRFYNMGEFIPIK